MYIPEHKIKAAAVFILAIGIGIGIPLFSRMQNKDTQAALLQPGTGTDFTTPNNNNAIIAPAAPSNTKIPSMECSANPPAVYVNDEVTWTLQTHNILYPDLLTYTWSGAATGVGKTVKSTHSMPATYSAKVKFTDFELGTKEANCSVNVLDKPTPYSQPTPSPTPNPNPSPTPSPSPNPSPNPSSSPTPPAESGLSDTAGQSAAGTDNSPAPDIVSCKTINSTLVLSLSQISVVRCKLQPPAVVTARVVKGEYSPPNEPDAASVLRTLVYAKTVYDKAFSFNWNGIDSYDTQVPDGTYTFVVEARQSAGAKPDISVQKIQVVTNPPETQQTEETTSENPEPSTQQTAKETPPPAPPAPPAQPPKAPEPSKCPGVNYPVDTETHWANAFVKAAYDNCIFRGYSDGTFRPNLPITRGEAVKTVLVAAGVSPKLGCYDTDCGTPFEDLVTWQSQWLRAAWDLKIVKGVSNTLFVPQRPITRGEGAVLIAKAFKIPPAKNCYTANCGAGYPNNFFVDINDPVQGSYLRALWDRKIIQGTGPNTFDPNRQMTRAEMAKFVIRTAQALGKIKMTEPESSMQPTQPADSKQSPQSGTQQESLSS